MLSLTQINTLSPTAELNRPATPPPVAADDHALIVVTGEGATSAGQAALDLFNNVRVVVAQEFVPGLPIGEAAELATWTLCCVDVPAERVTLVIAPDADPAELLPRVSRYRAAVLHVGPTDHPMLTINRAVQDARAELNRGRW